jgi:hypothetical protein
VVQKMRAEKSNDRFFARYRLMSENKNRQRGAATLIHAR